jgi:hypothetical protein
MFLNIGKFTKLMKEAYKVGLKIGNINGGTVIYTGHWAAWIENEHVNNKIKAVIMELAGELPEPGTMFEISKHAPDPQMMIETQTIEDIFDAVEDAENKMVVSPIVMDDFGGTRLLQACNELKTIIGIPEDQYQMIDKGAVDLEIEGEPTGPCYCADQYGSIYWYNDIGTVIIMPRPQKESKVYEALREVDFAEKDDAE